MRLLSYLAMFILTMLLAACGGGGGAPGLSSLGTQFGTSATLTSTAPANITLAVGTGVSYPFVGGAMPFSVTTDNPSVISVSITDTTLTIYKLKAGSAIAQVTDAKGIKLSIGVSDAVGSVLYTTAPSAGITLAVSANTVFAVRGGTPPYTVASSNEAIASASISTGATEGSVWLNAKAGGTATIDVRDSMGAVVSVPVTVSSTAAAKFFIYAPDSVTLTSQSQTTTSSTYIISGGASPYRCVSNDTAVADCSATGTVLTVSVPKRAAGTSSLKIFDAAGSVLSLGVTVNATGTTAGATTTATNDPILTSQGFNNTSNSISASGATTLTVKLTDPSLIGIPNQVIQVAPPANNTQITFPEGTAGLTNAQGIATIKIARASLLASGAGALTVTYDYKPGALTTYPDGTAPPSAAKVVTTYVGYQLATSNVTLNSLSAGASRLAPYGTTQVSVTANVNGVPQSGITVNFGASCGQIPLSATTNSNGVASVSYTASDATTTTTTTTPATGAGTSGCSGRTVEISASTLGAQAATTSINVDAATATNLKFSSAAPTRIYLSGSGGSTQSIVTFQLVDANNSPISGKNINFTLKTTTSDVISVAKASLGTIGNTSNTASGTTDASGTVSIPVFSGTIPTSVIVNAALASNTSVQTDSAVLAIASGRPAQARVSLSISEMAIRGMNFDGATTKVTMSLADRQGNPVPDGTVVNFVTEGGVMIPPTCTTGTTSTGTAGDSQCSVQLRTQNPRPANGDGLVTILAYVAGEEDFVDANRNNVYDCGEQWTDLPLAYRDDFMVANGVANAFQPGEFSVPRTASSSTCATAKTPNEQTGDNVWGTADVRAQLAVVFSTDQVRFINPVATRSVLSVSIQDGNLVRNNSVPTNSKISASVKAVAVGSTCALAGQTTDNVSNSLGPLQFSAWYSGCSAGDTVTVTVTPPAPSSGVWSATYSIP
ncbi:MAG: hypothetical protein RIR79_95 [Pseudomonadota bacterium]|jgi:hypothetical protein